MNGLEPAQVREQLERILASDGFRDAGRLGSFVRYVVEAALVGDSGRLKESVLGVEVFQRAPDYDPRTDPIVRVEARRLRSRLEEFYRTNPSEPVRITLPKGGYVPVFDRAEATIPPPPAARIATRRKVVSGPLIVFGILIGVALGLTWLYRARDRAQRQPTPAVAVMPFRNLSNDPSNQYFGDGLAIELIDALAKVETLRVVSWAAAARYREQQGDLDLLKRELQAGAVLDGTVRKEGDRIRVTAQLTDTTTRETIWSSTYEKEAKDIFRIQEEMARAIVYGLKVQLRVDPTRILVPPRTDNTAAIEDYFRARTERNNFSAEGLFRSNQFAERAIAADPKYVPAYALVAGNYSMLGYYRVMQPGQAFARAKEVAMQAIAMDNSSGEAHAAYGVALAMGDWRWKDAEREFVRAVRLTPGSADVHSTYAIAYLLPKGRLEDAELEIRRSLEIDPYSFFANYVAAYVFLQRGNLDAAITQYQKCLRIYAEFPDLHWDYGMALAFAGRKDEAREAFRAVARLRDRKDWKPGAVEAALLGDFAEAKRLAPLLQNNCMEAARAYALAGEPDLAIQELQTAVDRRESQVIYIQADRRLASLRNHSKFQSLLQATGLSD